MYMDFFFKAAVSLLWPQKTLLAQSDYRTTRRSSPFLALIFYVYTYIVAAYVISNNLLYHHIVVEKKNCSHFTDEEMQNRNIKDS